MQLTLAEKNNNPFLLQLPKELLLEILRNLDKSSQISVITSSRGIYKKLISDFYIGLGKYYLFQKGKGKDNVDLNEYLTSEQDLSLDENYKSTRIDLENYENVDREKILKVIAYCPEAVLQPINFIDNKGTRYTDISLFQYMIMNLDVYAVKVLIKTLNDLLLTKEGVLKTTLTKQDHEIIYYLEKAYQQINQAKLYDIKPYLGVLEEFINKHQFENSEISAKDFLTISLQKLDEGIGSEYFKKLNSFYQLDSELVKQFLIHQSDLPYILKAEICSNPELGFKTTRSFSPVQYPKSLIAYPHEPFFLDIRNDHAISENSLDDINQSMISLFNREASNGITRTSLNWLNFDNTKSFRLELKHGSYFSEHGYCIIREDLFDSQYMYDQRQDAGEEDEEYTTESIYDAVSDENIRQEEQLFGDAFKPQYLTNNFDELEENIAQQQSPLKARPYGGEVIQIGLSTNIHLSSYGHCIERTCSNIDDCYIEPYVTEQFEVHMKNFLMHFVYITKLSNTFYEGMQEQKVYLEQLLNQIKTKQMTQPMIQNGMFSSLKRKASTEDLNENWSKKSCTTEDTHDKEGTPKGPTG